MASIDLKEAYYSVPMAKEHQKCLKFKWGYTLFQFTCFPNGLSFCPRTFTKLLKPVYSVLKFINKDTSLPLTLNIHICKGQTMLMCDKCYCLRTHDVHFPRFYGPSQQVCTHPYSEIDFLGGFVLDSVLLRAYLTLEKSSLF